MDRQDPTGARPTILLTRPAAQSARFAARLTDLLGADVRIVVSPVLDIMPDPDAAADALSRAGSVLFTSENAVAACARPAAAMTAFCVGPRTAEAAQAKGFRTETGPGDALGLTAMMKARGSQGHEAPLIHLRGAHVSGDIVGWLAEAGLPIEGVVVYDQRARPLSPAAQTLLRSRNAVIVPIFSPRTARLLAPELAQARASLRIAAISPAVAAHVPVHSAAGTVIAAEPDADAMLAAIRRLWENACFLEDKDNAG
jgi:uroporphyrinogen-III synthase